MTKFFMYLTFVFSLTISSCGFFETEYDEVYQHTDYFVESLQTTYTSYGALGGMDHMKYTEDGKYQIFPMGRLINVKILQEVPLSEYEELREDLENHYEGDSRVNQVYICAAGTVMVDCRR
jgi:hypothetical protein